MKAIVCTQYGGPDVLALQEVQAPVPQDHEVLIKVLVTTVTAADSMMRQGIPWFGRLFLGVLKPKASIPGTGFAGKVAAVGKAVTQFHVGDPVLGETGVNMGAYAEYVCLPEDGIVAIKPAKIGFQEAAPICDGVLTAFNFLKHVAPLECGQRILINGASGSIGTAAVQLAKSLGAEVTGVCSTKNLGLVKSLGADQVIDYQHVDFTKTGQTYDIIFDTVGKSSFSACKNALTPKGIYLSPVLSFPLLWNMLWTAKGDGQKAKFSATGLRPAVELRTFLSEVIEEIESGQIQIVIDRNYPFEQMMEAHRYVDQGHKTGNLVITLE